MSHEVQKLYRLKDGSVFGGAGNPDDIMNVLAWLNEGGDPNSKPSDLESDFLLVTTDNKAYNFGSGLALCEVRSPYVALGSGCMAAIAALYCGVTVREAIKIAKRVDIYSGGRVRHMDV